MKEKRIASLPVISQNMILGQAHKGSKTNIEAGGRFLEKKCFACNVCTGQFVKNITGHKGQRTKSLLLACRRNKHTRPCISCHRVVVSVFFPNVALTRPFQRKKTPVFSNFFCSSNLYDKPREKRANDS